jgi:uncharacterized protein with gpF-like domain
MRYDLAAMARRASNPRRKRSVTLRDIVPPAVMASNLYLAGYKPAIDLWRTYAERVIAEYERTLSSLITDAPADINRTLDEADSAFQRLFLLLRPAMRDWTVRTESWFRGKWRGAVLSATNVDIGTLIGPEDARQTLEQSLEWNVNLVADVSAQARQRISAAVFDGLRNTKPTREVAKDIRDAVDMGRDRSVRIALDQLAKLTSSLADERRREAGIEEWEWRWSRKLHGRAEHIARNGKVYADTTSGADPTRDVLPPPPDRPGQLPYCGCRALGRIVFD